MYGLSGAEIGECDDFLSTLESQTVDENTVDQSGVYIPSPQGMLNTGVDPYAQTERFDQILSLPEDSWNEQKPWQQGVEQEQSWQRPEQEWADKEWVEPDRKSSWDSNHSSHSLKDEIDDYDAPGVEGGGVSKRTSSARQRKAKTSHNMIEKRYRNNINDKINVLRDCVPTLRDAAATTVADGVPSIRLNKATVLTKAAEYIEQLKARNKLLVKENSELKARVTGRPRMAPGVMHPHQSSSQMPPQPMHYRQPPPQQRRGLGSNVALGCATAGLLATGSVLSSGASDGQFRGLSAVPLSVVNLIPWEMPSTSAIKATSLIVVCSVLGVYYLALLGMWSSAPPPQKASIASREALETHQQHRLIALQTSSARLGLIPSTNALASVTMILSLVSQALVACVFGAERLQAVRSMLGYSFDPEAGSYVEQLIDTQMTCLDSDCVNSWSLLCSWLVGFTYKSSARRNMLQALQLRLLTGDTIIQKPAELLASWLWRRSAEDAESLPTHLQTLRSVPLNEIIDPTAYFELTPQGMKVIISRADSADPQVVSVLDLLASLHSFRLQDRAMARTLEGVEMKDSDLKLAAKLAPRSSYAQFRLLGLRALFLGEKNSKIFKESIQEFQVGIKTNRPQSVMQNVFTCAIANHLASIPGCQEYATSLVANVSINSDYPSIFISLLVALRQLRANNLGRSDLVEHALQVREWLGMPEAERFGLSLQVRRDLITETLAMAKSFASRPADEMIDIELDF